MIRKAFQKFLANLAVSNRSEISTTYCRITSRLNKDFHGIESETQNSLQVGSFGRRTAIDGISDLDMIFELDRSDFDRINAREGNGQSALLQEVKTSLLESYPRTQVRGDGPVVVVPLKHHHFEVLPAFLQSDGTYIYGVTRDGGSWASTDPRAERNEFDRFDAECDGNVRAVAKMLRAWKNESGAPIGGWLIDTLSYQFFQDNVQYRKASLEGYGDLVASLFAFLANLDDDGSWPAPGSGEIVRAKGKFTGKAKKAARKCAEALDEESLLEKTKRWRSVFGRSFELLEEVYKEERLVKAYVARYEQFIEDKFPVDIRGSVKVDYEVTENKVKLWDLVKVPRRLRRLPIGRGLRFYLANCSIPEPFNVYWKVRNRGVRAREQERGEIVPDQGSRQLIERTAFSGNHYVEVYVVKDGVCVARDRADVPIIE